MGFAAIGTALSIGSSAVGAYSGYQQARAQNDAIARNNAAVARAQQSQAEAAGIQQGQVAEAGQQARREQARQAAQIRGRIRANAAGRGVSETGSVGALIRQTDSDLAENLASITSNTDAQLAAVRSGAAANIAGLDAQFRSESFNPLITGIGGAFSGLGSGLAIGRGLRDIFNEPV